MNVMGVIWRNYLLTGRQALRHDAGARMTSLIRLLLLGSASYWVATVWAAHLASWQALGPAHVRAPLLLILLGVALPVALLQLWTTYQVGFARDEAMVLFLTPMRPEVRFRSLLMLVLMEGAGQWLLFGSIISAYSLLTALGWQGVGWFLSVVASLLFGVLFGVIAAVSLQIISAGQPRRVATAFRTVVPIVLLAAAALAAGWYVTAQAPGADGWLPYGIALLLYSLLGACAGPLARQMGELYISAFQLLQSNEKSGRGFALPGATKLAAKLAGRRTLFGALLYKGVLSHSRNSLVLVRVLALIAAAVGFPSVRDSIGTLPGGGLVLVVGYTLLVVAVSVNESVVNAIAGEGERMKLYLAAPVPVHRYLWSRFAACLIPVLTSGGLLALITGRLAKLGALDQLYALAVVILALIGCTGLLVWGGAWDEDIEAPVEGAAQTLIQEEAPVSPKRFPLVLLGVIFNAAMAGALLLVGAPRLLLLQLMIDGLVLALFWRIGKACLYRLTQ